MKFQLFPRIAARRNAINGNQPPRQISEAEPESIRFKCRACRQPAETGADMMGSYIECQSCGAQTKVPLHVYSFNPFRRPIRQLVRGLTRIQWRFPFFPQFIEAVVLLFVVLVMTALYLTVGMASQVAGIFHSLMLDAQHEIKSGSLIEKSAYAVTGGIYVVLWLPFWLLLLPFTLLGWLWSHLGYWGLIILAAIFSVATVWIWKTELLSAFGMQ